MNKKNTKLALNKQVVSNLNGIVGGYAPTHDCTGNGTVVKFSDKCATKQNTACVCW